MINNFLIQIISTKLGAIGKILKPVIKKMLPVTGEISYKAYPNLSVTKFHVPGYKLQGYQLKDAD